MNVGIEKKADSAILSEPLAFIRGGDCHWGSSALNVRGAGSRYWSSLSINTAQSRFAGSSSTAIIPANALDNGYGFTVRCVFY